MDPHIKSENEQQSISSEVPSTPSENHSNAKGKTKSKDKEASGTNKRRCVSTACIACRRRKSKCDGNLPKCAACASVYLTECEYAPHTDHRRKGVYKKDVDSLKTKNSTLQVLIQAILNYDEDDVPDLIRQIRTCDNLEDLAASLEAKEKGQAEDTPDSPIYQEESSEVPIFEAELSGKMGDLLVDGSVKFIGGTSNLIWLPDNYDYQGSSPSSSAEVVRPKEEAILSWTKVTQEKDLILHFLNMYFCWHYAYFTTLSKELFYRDFLTGTSSQYCSAFLVNVMLALGCHFSSRPAARANSEDSGTTGDHYFAEAKRLMYENDEFANAKLCTVQALALMSVREAGCGRESKGWVYSGMSFRMACDLGLNVDAQPMNESSRLTDEDIDARRITFWGCFLFDKCWSNYLGRQPQLQLQNITVKKPEVFPSEDSEMWSPYTDSGIIHAHAQSARTRAIALQISKLAEISADLLISFYHPQLLDKPLGKQTELKKLSDLHTRLETWKKELPNELEPREGQLPQVLLMHMFYQLLYIHLYRPFLKYNRATSPLPAHISPRKFCTQSAGAISKLFRLYKRIHGLRQICNIAIYIAHSACTIHLLNLPDKNAKRDIVHGVKHLEEMGECWTAARRTLRILYLCAEKWKMEVPEDAEQAFARARVRWGFTDPSASPSSPNSLTNMTAHLDTQPVEDMMAHNVRLQMQQQQRNSASQPSSFGGQTATSQFQGGLSVPVAPSPADTIETRRSSGGMSMPPQSAADFTRNTHKMRPSTNLTKAQKDAWSAHQSRMNTNTNMMGFTGNRDQNGNASVMFGGVDSLMEESQDWWFKDQSQLALGFDNWTAPTQDWSSFDLGYTNGGNVNSGPLMNTNQFSFSDANGASNGFADYAANSFGNLQSMDDSDINMNVNANTNMNMNMNTHRNSNNPQTQRLSYENDIFY